MYLFLHTLKLPIQAYRLGLVPRTCVKKQDIEPGELAQQLKALTVLPEDPGGGK